MGMVKDVKEAVFGLELTNLHDLFVAGLKDIYYAEKSLKTALKEMADNACTSELSQAFAAHREETELHIERLEAVFAMLDMQPQSQTCEAIKGLIAEGDEVIEEAEDSAMDAGLIYAAQAVEHYEIARYGTLVTWAKKLGMIEAANLLQQTLNEEKDANEKLTDLATRGVNDIALTGEFLELRPNPTRGQTRRVASASAKGVRM